MVDIAADITTTATFLGPGYGIGSISGEFETFGDVDWIKVTLDALFPYSFFGSVSAAGPTGGDAYMELRDATGALISSSDDHGIGRNSYLTYTPASTATYYLTIRAYNSTTPGGEYTISYRSSGTPTYLTDQADTYTATGGGNFIGGAGNDRITGAVEGYAFDAYGEQGDDYLVGNLASNYISGGTGDDTIYGMDFLDVLLGDAGHDYIDGGEGTDQIWGGSGYDYLLGGTGDDKLHGGDDGDYLSGGANNDELRGGTGDDRIFGGDGDDKLWGDSGKDHLDGGAGNDLYAVGGDKSDTIVDSAGIDTIQAGVTWSLVGNPTIERLFLTGTAAINGTGNALGNNIQGNAGANVLSGGNGNDSLQGNGGADTLTGGVGGDYFVYKLVSDSTPTVRDTITDFKDSGADKIHLDAVYAGTLFYVGTAGFSAAGQIRAVQAGADVNVFVNVNNDTVADMQIVLKGTTLGQIGIGDFVL